MFRATRKLIAVILAIWLPLFSGNALAMSVAMQAMRGGCDSVAAQQDESHCASTQQHARHDQLAAEQDQSSSHQGNAGDDCGTCHLTCCGYLAAASVEAMGDQPSALLFQPVSTQFQSFTSAPLDPPPLSRA